MVWSERKLRFFAASNVILQAVVNDTTVERSLTAVGVRKNVGQREYCIPEGVGEKRLLSLPVEWLVKVASEEILFLFLFLSY